LKQTIYKHYVSLITVINIIFVEGFKLADENESMLIQVRKKTAERIKQKATEFGDTYDIIITRWLDSTEKTKK